MNAAKKARLLASGYTTGTVAEFLHLSPVEAEIIQTRIAMKGMVGKLRTQGCIINDNGDGRDTEGRDYDGRFDAED